MSTNFLSTERIESPLAPVSLVVGGIRSGKSAFAEAMVGRAAKPVYVATAEPLDSEMCARIRAHQARRGCLWDTIEEPIDLVPVLQNCCHGERAVLVDCLSLWMSNLLIGKYDLDAESEKLIQSLPSLTGPVCFVSTEVGLGGISGNSMARQYADALGTLHQRIGAVAQRVYWVVAGIPRCIKNEQ